MALSPARELTFDEDDLAPAEAQVATLLAAGAGWINFVPEVEPDHEPPPRNPLASIFSARGDAVPMATWTAPDSPGGRSSLGIEHGSGPKALLRLGENGLALPERWIKVADHPRRGLVITAPAAAEPEELVWWLLTATHALSVVPLTGAWLARVYEPARR